MADNDPIPQPLIEQTSSSEHHYELMALVQAIQSLTGVGSGGLGGSDVHFAEIVEELHAIRTLLEQSHTATESIRQEVQQVLEAHAQSAQEYMHQIDEPVPVDYYPFVSMPTGTSVRNLPDGGRLFGFTDGAFLRVFADKQMSFIDEGGTAVPVPPPVGGKVTLPDGRELALIPDAIKVTHEAAGIEGLPEATEPVLASPGRYTVVLPDGTRLDVYHRERAIAVINTSGTIDVLGILRIYGIGEEVQSRSVSGGAKNFRALESGHAGMIEADGTIHLSLSNGLDLIVHFPDDPGRETDEDHGSMCLNCVEPD